MNKVLRSLVFLSLVSSPALAQPLSLLAEDNYPNNFLVDGNLKGRSVDVLRETFKRADVPFTMNVLPWARAYDTALKSDGSCVFSTAHTAERDASFKWIEPLNTIEMMVVASPNHLVSVKNNDDLHHYTIGTYLGDYRESVLKSMGMRIESVTDDALNAEKLRRGRIDLWATDKAHLSELKNEFLPVYTFYKVDLALARNKNIDSNTADRLQKALKSVHEDGTFDKLLSAYSAE